MDILELNNKITKKKNLSIMEKTEERINELEDRTIEITQSEQQRENKLKKLSGDTENCGSIKRAVTFV